MKRIGGGTVGMGIVGIGWALSIGIVSIGMNAVGWIAIGLNAAGFVAIGLVNSVGVFSFGGVNSCGAWEGGRANAPEGASSVLGIVVSAVVLAGFLVARVRTWPIPSPQTFLSLETTADEARVRGCARIAAIDGEFVELLAGEERIRAQAPPHLLALCVALGCGVRVEVHLRRAARPAEGAGYRDDALTFVHELTAVVHAPTRSWLHAAFGDLVGFQLLLAVAGLAAAIVASRVWR